MSTSIAAQQDIKPFKLSSHVRDTIASVNIAASFIYTKMYVTVHILNFPSLTNTAY